MNRRNRLSGRLAGAALAGVTLLGAGLAGTPSSTAAQTGTTDGEWRYWAGDAGSTRYAPLDQIDASNVGDLDIAWRWQARNFGPTPEAYYRVTPLYADGMLYATAGFRRAAVAIDPATGETLWMYRLDEGERGRNAPRGNSGRGVGYWTDGTEKRVLLISPAYHMVSLDAETGVPDPDFGENGIVDLKLGLGREIDLVNDRIGSSSPPVVVGDVIVVGAALPQGGEAADEGDAAGPRARIRCAHRRTVVDLPHHPAAGRSGARDVGGRDPGTTRERRGLDPVHGGPRPGVRLPARGGGDRRLLRRPPAGGQPLFPEPRVRGRAHGRSRVVLPDSAPRDLGLRPAGGARVDGHHGGGGGRSRPWRRSRSRPSPTSSTARRASRCGRSRSGPCPLATCPANGTRPRSPSRRCRCRSTCRGRPRTTSSTSRRNSGPKRWRSRRTSRWANCSRRPRCSWRGATRARSSRPAASAARTGRGPRTTRRRSDCLWGPPPGAR